MATSFNRDRMRRHRRRREDGGSESSPPSAVSRTEQFDSVGAFQPNRRVQEIRAQVAQEQHDRDEERANRQHEAYAQSYWDMIDSRSGNFRGYVHSGRPPLSTPQSRFPEGTSTFGPSSRLQGARDAQEQSSRRQPRQSQPEQSAGQSGNPTSASPKPQANAFGLIGNTREERIDHARRMGIFDQLRDSFNQQTQSLGQKRIMDFDGNILVGPAYDDFLARNQPDPVPRNDQDQALLSRNGRPRFDSRRPSSVFPA